MLTKEEMLARIIPGYFQNAGINGEKPMIVELQDGKLVRVGFLYPERGWYEEYSNFNSGKYDYCDMQWDEEPLWLFYCEWKAFDDVTNERYLEGCRRHMRGEMDRYRIAHMAL